MISAGTWGRATASSASCKSQSMAVLAAQPPMIMCGRHKHLLSMAPLLIRPSLPFSAFQLLLQYSRERRDPGQPRPSRFFGPFRGISRRRVSGLLDGAMGVFGLPVAMEGHYLINRQPPRGVLAHTGNIMEVGRITKQDIGSSGKRVACWV